MYFWKYTRTDLNYAYISIYHQLKDELRGLLNINLLTPYILIEEIVLGGKTFIMKSTFGNWGGIQIVQNSMDPMTRLQPD